MLSILANFDWGQFSVVAGSIAAPLAAYAGVKTAMAQRAKVRTDTISVSLASLKDALSRSDQERSELDAKVDKLYDVLAKQREDNDLALAKQRRDCDKETSQLRSNLATLSRRISVEHERCQQKLLEMRLEMQRLKGE